MLLHDDHRIFLAHIYRPHKSCIKRRLDCTASLCRTPGQLAEYHVRLAVDVGDRLICLASAACPHVESHQFNVAKLLCFWHVSTLLKQHAA